MCKRSAVLLKRWWVSVAANALRHALNSVIASATDAFWDERGVCSLCLGALERIDDHVNNVLKAAASYAPRGATGASRQVLRECAPAVELSLTVPATLLIRHTAAVETFDGEPTVACAHGAKDALRMMLHHSLGLDEFFGEDHENVGRRVLKTLTISVNVEAPNQDDEIEALPRRLQPQPPRPTRSRRGANKRRRTEIAMPPGRVADALTRLSNAERSSLATRLFAQTRPPAELRPVFVQASCARESVYVVGRYRKLSRVMPQTPWTVEGRRKGVSSVEEVLAEAIRPAFTSVGAIKFLASGREDCDVRMLGPGRPFGVEVVDPRALAGDAFSCAQVAAAVSRISTALKAPVEAVDLRVADKAAVVAVDASAGTKRKTYACVIWVERPLETSDASEIAAISNLEVAQKTPVRVMHTRSLATRIRVVHKMELNAYNSHFGVLHITTAAGMYIKEFVHGDFGRTTPSLGDLLGTRADILQLDVVDIELDEDPQPHPDAQSNFAS
ncbi:hypothetical protein CTAYLR_003951 [Chrysophaeum taylorii]|uniref:tRNA pseudouridine(55) synthase n=1 Tax=Chrysophaeum taylorii TaxID=2483200 RepID=A0AAD7UB51_9STRA|nr:hypothetical protein CTAYLR_003951 [Chrysophaeum taylorii]